MDLCEISRMTSDQEFHHWWIRTRFLYLEDAVKKSVAEIPKDHFRPLNLVEMGCGTGQNLRFLRTESAHRAQIGPLIGVDPAFPDPLPQIEGLNEGDWIGRSLERAPRKNDFDLLIAMDVLEHIPDDERALQEWLTLLRPGGRLFIMVPALPALWSEYDVELAHQRRYTRAGLRSLIRKVSGSDPLVRYAFSFALPPAFLIRRLGLGGKKSGELKPTPHAINTALQFAGKVESLLLGNLVPGTSLIASISKGLKPKGER